MNRQTMAAAAIRGCDVAPYFNQLRLGSSMAWVLMHTRRFQPCSQKIRSSENGLARHLEVKPAVHRRWISWFPGNLGAVVQSLNSNVLRHGNQNALFKQPLLLETGQRVSSGG